MPYLCGVHKPCPMPRYWQLQGVVTCRLWKCLWPWSSFLIAKKCAWSLDWSLLRLLLRSWSLDFQGSKVTFWLNGHWYDIDIDIAAVHSWLLFFSSSEVTLTPWLAPQKGFDRLIQFWSRSQTLLHGTYKWLPLAAGPFAHVLVSLPDWWPWSLVWERDFVCSCVHN